jgi:Animal haem peroxidase
LATKQVSFYLKLETFYLQLPLSSVFRGAILQNAFNKTINETYNKNADPQCTNEFNTATYRFLHYYVPSDVQFTTKDGETTNIPVSDTVGRFDMAENKFDDLVRGIFNQSANFGQYSDEVNEYFLIAFVDGKNVNLQEKNKIFITFDSFTINLPKTKMELEWI